VVPASGQAAGRARQVSRGMLQAALSVTASDRGAKVQHLAAATLSGQAAEGRPPGTALWSKNIIGILLINLSTT
jgi:hypothetical protein